MTSILKWCPTCGAETEVIVSKIGYKKWHEGMVIQKALPSLSATEREVLITGLCPKCQGDVFHD